MKKRVLFNILGGLTAAGLLVTGCAGDSGSTGTGSAGNSASSNVTLNVYNWGDYIDEDVLDMFTEETGIRINYDNFDTNETMYTKIKNTGASYDIAFPSDYMITKMINEDMLLEIDFDNIPNYEHIGDQFKNLDYDPDGKYSVPYMWGTLGILYNTEMVDDAVDSWDILWNEKYAGEIFMYSSQRDSLTPALVKLGYSINTTNTAELDAARDLLIDQMPLVQAYMGDSVKDKMIGNEGALALVYSGDALYCQDENPALDYAVPKEGSNKWFDAVVIPSTAKNKEAAEMFIDFLCRPDIAAMNSDYIGYTTSNISALDLMDDEVIQNPIFWPSDEIFDNCEVFVDLGDFVQEIDRAWTEVLSSFR